LIFHLSAASILLALPARRADLARRAVQQARGQAFLEFLHVLTALFGGEARG
jgi:hypothetical protein